MSGVGIMVSLIAFALFGRFAERLEIGFFTLLYLTALVAFLGLAVTGNLP